MLANEQVINGACERCGAQVEQRSLEQWFFRISEYAERLLNNLDRIDWSETTKTAQRNWIGRSDGAEIEFEVPDSRRITVFTTRPDTIFGATYLVLAPEHPLVARLTTEAQRAEVEAYRERTKRQDLVTRKVTKENRTLPRRYVVQEVRYSIIEEKVLSDYRIRCSVSRSGKNVP